MTRNIATSEGPRVVIVGAGFGGLAAAKRLSSSRRLRTDRRGTLVMNDKVMISNIYDNAQNQRFYAAAYLAAAPACSVVEYHLAGRTDAGNLLIDTHDHALSDPVWALYRAAVRIIGDRPTLIERDSNIPPLAELVAEASQADRICLSVANQEAGRAVFA